MHISLQYTLIIKTGAGRWIVFGGMAMKHFYSKMDRIKQYLQAEEGSFPKDLVEREDIDYFEEKIAATEGIIEAKKHIEEITDIVLNSKNGSEAKEELMRRFSLSGFQAGIVLRMKLKKLVTLADEELDQKLNLYKTLRGALLKAYAARKLEELRTELQEVLETSDDEERFEEILKKSEAEDFFSYNEDKRTFRTTVCTGKRIDGFEIEVGLNDGWVNFQTNSFLGVDEENRSALQGVLGDINRLVSNGKFEGNDDGIIFSYTFKLSDLEAMDNPFDAIFWGCEIFGKYQAAILQAVSGKMIRILKV